MLQTAGRRRMHATSSTEASSSANVTVEFNAHSQSNIAVVQTDLTNAVIGGDLLVSSVLCTRHRLLLFNGRKPVPGEGDWRDLVSKLRLCEQRTL